MTKRFWEIDFFRGLAVVLMILFNYAFALDYLGVYTLTEGWLFWWLFPRVVASMFIFLAGISLTIGYSRNKRISRHIRRGLWIFSWGIVLTIITWLFLPAGTVWFGILHFIGLSVIISLLFIKLRPKHLPAVALIFLLIGTYLNNLAVDFSWLLWLGVMPYNFSTLDYFPILPWFGIFLIGMAFGKTFYANGKRAFGLRREPSISKLLNFLGGHSLFIYLLHIPVLIVLLYFTGIF